MVLIAILLASVSNLINLHVVEHVVNHQCAVLSDFFGHASVTSCGDRASMTEVSLNRPQTDAPCQ